VTDFFTIDGMPWSRRLWDVGSLLALEELWEAGSWAAQRVLSPAACDWQRRALQAVVGPDIGLGERELRRELNGLLDKPIPEPSPARRRLRELIEHARLGYVERWAVALDRPVADRPRSERLARTIAAHLLDLGYHADYLLAWAEGMSRKQVTAPDLVNAAAELACAPRQRYRVLVALVATPRRDLAERLDTWLPKGASQGRGHRLAEGAWARHHRVTSGRRLPVRGVRSRPARNGRPGPAALGPDDCPIVVPSEEP
jgi:hypothetical protein